MFVLIKCPSYAFKKVSLWLTDVYILAYFDVPNLALLVIEQEVAAFTASIIYYFLKIASNSYIYCKVTSPFLVSPPETETETN